MLFGKLRSVNRFTSREEDFIGSYAKNCQGSIVDPQNMKGVIDEIERRTGLVDVTSQEILAVLAKASTPQFKRRRIRKRRHQVCYEST